MNITDSNGIVHSEPTTQQTAQLEMPNKENIQKWVDALRSGEYEQARETLKDTHDEKYCCLGVACELYRQENEKAYWDGYEFFDAEARGEYYEDETLSPAVARWLGVHDCNPRFPADVVNEINTEKWFIAKGEADATFLNDELKADFNQIADAIERTYLQ